MKQENRELMIRRTELPSRPEGLMLRMSAQRSLWIIALAVCFAAGCGASHPIKYYQLTVPGNPPTANANPIPITLLIGRLTAPALYREDQIVYGTGGESMGVYEYHRWSEPPTEMISEVMVRQFRASGHYRGVYTLRSDIRGDYLLHGHLYDLKEVDAGSLVARVTMELELRNIKTGTTVWTHFYTHDEPAAAKTTDAIVAALDKGVQQGVAEVRAGLEEYFAANPPKQDAP